MIRIIAVGKMKEAASVTLLKEYVKRIGGYSKLELIEVEDEKNGDRDSEKEQELVKQKEGKRILAKIKPEEYVILLSLQGDMISSESLSSKIHQLFVQGKSTITFIIGGSLGTSQEIAQRANWLWKLSDLTFPHQLVRVMLAEQIYRAFTIQNQLPYHK